MIKQDKVNENDQSNTDSNYIFSIRDDSVKHDQTQLEGYQRPELVSAVASMTGHQGTLGATTKQQLMTTQGN